MSRAGRDVRGTRLVLCALALVLGLLGMHGLASQHAVMQGMSPVSAGSSLGTMAGMAADHAALAPDTGDHSPAGMGALCLAVLGGGLVLLVGLGDLARCSARLEVGRRPGAARAPTSRTSWPPLDPVAGLCVSRT